MRSKQWIVVLGGAVGIVALVMVCLPPKHKTAAPAPSARAAMPETPAPKGPAPTAARPAPAQPPAPQPALRNELPEGEKPVRVVRVPTDVGLATVNGVTITLKDLAGLSAAQAGADQPMSPEMYDALLQRAINRELVVQAARAQNIGLTEEQRKQVASQRSRMERQQADVVQLTMSPERVEFETRDTTALLLQNNLAAKAGLPSPYVTPELVEQYYRDHKADYGDLPTDAAAREAAWQQIDSAIRTKLAPTVQAAYDEQMRKLLDDLKAKASIVAGAPVVSFRTSLSRH